MPSQVMCLRTKSKRVKTRGSWWYMQWFWKVHSECTCLRTKITSSKVGVSRTGQTGKEQYLFIKNRTIQNTRCFPLYLWAFTLDDRCEGSETMPSQVTCLRTKSKRVKTRGSWWYMQWFWKVHSECTCLRTKNDIVESRGFTSTRNKFFQNRTRTMCFIEESLLGQRGP